MRLSVALNEFAAIQNALRQLSDYYGSDAWKQDLPLRQDYYLKTSNGVLSECRLESVGELRDLKDRMAEIVMVIKSDKQE